MRGAARQACCSYGRTRNRHASLSQLPLCCNLLQRPSMIPAGKCLCVSLASSSFSRLPSCSSCEWSLHTPHSLISFSLCSIVPSAELYGNDCLSGISVHGICIAVERCLHAQVTHTMSALGYYIQDRQKMGRWPSQCVPFWHKAGSQQPCASWVFCRYLFCFCWC